MYNIIYILIYSIYIYLFLFIFEYGYLKFNIRFLASIIFLLDSIGIEQWFSTKGDIAPRGYLAMSGDNCLSQLGQSYWHLIGRSQGCYNAQDIPTTNNYLIQNVNSAKVEKPWYREVVKEQTLKSDCPVWTALTSYVALGKLPNLSLIYTLHLKNGVITIPSSQSCWRN